MSAGVRSTTWGEPVPRASGTGPADALISVAASGREPVGWQRRPISAAALWPSHSSTRRRSGRPTVEKTRGAGTWTGVPAAVTLRSPSSRPSSRCPGGPAVACHLTVTPAWPGAGRQRAYRERMGVLQLLDELPEAIARPPSLLWSVLARSLGEQGGAGRTALAWRWALTGGRP